MILLALDTATSAITTAVRDDTTVRAVVATQDTRRHTEHLAPNIEEVMGRSGVRMEALTHLAVGIGPGPFTGLRVGIVTALTLGAALGIPVHGVCSLDALALATSPIDDQDELVVATDARRKEVYWARYRRAAHGWTRESGPQVLRPQDLDPALRALPCAGRGPALFPGLFARPHGPLDVSAVDIAALAAAEIAAGRHTAATPMYLRRPDAQEPAGPKAALNPAQTLRARP